MDFDAANGFANPAEVPSLSDQPWGFVEISRGVGDPGNLRCVGCSVEHAEDLDLHGRSFRTMQD